MIASGSKERVDIWSGDIRQRIALQIAPQHLDRIELGRVGREVGAVHSFGAGEVPVHELGTMSIGTIPDHQKPLLDLTAQLAEERPCSQGGDVGVGVEGEIKSYALAARRNGQGGYGGYLPMRPACAAKDRGASAQGPGSPNKRSHQEAALVDEDDIRSQLAGFFLSCGQSTAIQRLIVASFRSRASACGFCGLKPSPRSRRPI